MEGEISYRVYTCHVRSESSGGRAPGNGLKKMVVLRQRYLVTGMNNTRVTHQTDIFLHCPYVTGIFLP